MSKTSQNLKSFAWLLSIGGFLPFALIAAALFLIGDLHVAYPFLFDIFKIWSAVILSFLGGIRWGLAIAYAPGERRNLVLSVLPSIFGWFAILLPNAYTLLVLIVLYCAQGAWDNFYAGSGRVQPWFGPLRVVLTLLVVSAHIVVLFSVTGTPDIGKLGEFLQQL